MLPGYFNYIFVHLRQKVLLRPEKNPKFLSTLGPNPARTRPEPDPKKPGPTYNSDTLMLEINLERGNDFPSSQVQHSFINLTKSDNVS